jgi:hypothetical protein
VSHWLSGAGQAAELVVWAQARRGDSAANSSNADSMQRTPDMTFMDVRARLGF